MLLVPGPLGSEGLGDPEGPHQDFDTGCPRGGPTCLCAPPGTLVPAPEGGWGWGKDRGILSNGGGRGSQRGGFLARGVRGSSPCRGRGPCPGTSLWGRHRAQSTMGGCTLHLPLALALLAPLAPVTLRAVPTPLPPGLGRSGPLFNGWDCLLSQGQPGCRSWEHSPSPCPFWVSPWALPPPPQPLSSDWLSSGPDASPHTQAPSPGCPPPP